MSQAKKNNTMTEKDYDVVRGMTRPDFNAAYDREYRLWHCDLRETASPKDKLQWNEMLEAFYDDFGYYPAFCGSRVARDIYETSKDTYV